FFNAMRETWTDAQMRAEAAKRTTPIPPSLLDALTRVYPDPKPVEIFAHTQGGLRYRSDPLTMATRKTSLHAAPAYVYVFAWKTGVLDGRPRAFHRSEIPFVFD